MPERRIDAIGKADAASWNTLHLPKGSPNLLRVISGQLSRMPVGEVMSAVVQKAAKGAFKITLNGETFIIKGLPASLLGKAVSFVARQTALAGKGGAELFWLGPSRASAPSMQQTAAQTATRASANNTSVQVRHRATVLSGMSAELIEHSKAGNIINGRIDAIQSGKMTLGIALADAKNPAKSINHQIQTTLIQGLKQGQNFSARIQLGMNNKAILEILPQQMNPAAVKATGVSPAALQTASFTLAAGDIVSGLVQKRLPNGHIQLNIQGISVETPAPKSITQGDFLVLRMNKPPAEFQLISAHKNSAEKAIAVVKKNLAISREPLANSMVAMRNVLPALAASGMSDIDGLAQLLTWFTASESEQKQAVNGEYLSRMMRDSGAGLEAKLLGLSQQLATNTPQNAALLHDLKTIMLQLSQAQTSNINHAGLIKILTELSQHSTARIETNQALNMLAQIQGDPIRFELPMLVGQQLVNVQMSVQQQGQQPSDQTGEGSGSDQSYHVLFALELSGLGKMRVDASISDAAVQARIYSDQADAGQFIRSHIQRLETRLQDMGYKEVYLLAAPSAPDAEKQRQFDQLTHMAPASLNLLDVIA